MNFKHKLGYMCIGCLFTILGYILASLGGITTHAQQEKQVLDEIVCRHLKVVNKEGTTVAGILATEDGNGDITVYNKAGKGVVSITTTFENGGLVVKNAEGNGAAVIHATTGGGRMSVANAASHIVVRIGADKDGNGEIRTDKGGVWRTH